MTAATVPKSPPEPPAPVPVPYTADELFTLFCVALMRCRPGCYPDWEPPDPQDLTCVQHSK